MMLKKSIIQWISHIRLDGIRSLLGHHLVELRPYTTEQQRLLPKLKITVCGLFDAEVKQFLESKQIRKGWVWRHPYQLDQVEAVMQKFIKHVNMSSIYNKMKCDEIDVANVF